MLSWVEKLIYSVQALWVGMTAFALLAIGVIVFISLNLQASQAPIETKIPLLLSWGLVAAVATFFAGILLTYILEDSRN